MRVSRGAAEALESGRYRGGAARALARVWGSLAGRALVRPATVPATVAVVSVGGATLGGSGKTRVAIAVASELAARGARVVLVGHAHRASPGRARVVRPDDALGDVGDEAIVCARALRDGGVAVVVAPTRQRALDHACALGPDAIVLDGPLRIAGAALQLSVLAVDAHAPWGSGALPPCGDLRAPRAAMLALADGVVEVSASPSRIGWAPGVVASGERLANAGLFTALGRPDRLVAALAAAGVRPRAIVSAPDHGPLDAALSRRLRDARVDAWIATDKCALHLARGSLEVPVGIIASDLMLPEALSRALDRLLKLKLNRDNARFPRGSAARDEGAHMARLDPSRSSAIVSGGRRPIEMPSFFGAGDT